MLGTMLHLDIQKSKEAMKALVFQQDIGGTPASINIITKANIKGVLNCHQTAPYFYDIWFIRIKKSEEANIKGVDCCGPVKTNHKGFCLYMLEKSTKEWFTGSHLVMKI